MRRDIVVVGASAGGVEAVSKLVENIAGFKGAMFIVIHTGSGGPGLLAELLNRRGTLPVLNAEDGKRIQPGYIHVAPPDNHLVLEHGRMRLIKGPLENRHRPSIDALFRSAANVYGPQVIGVVLTGYLDDGSAGMLAIKRKGGLAVVQDPRDALVPAMPPSVRPRTENQAPGGRAHGQPAARRTRSSRLSWSATRRKGASSRRRRTATSGWPCGSCCTRRRWLPGDSSTWPGGRTRRRSGRAANCWPSC